MTSMTALLFGSIEQIVLHCAAARIESALDAHVRPLFSPSIAVSIQPPILGMEYVQIHYSAGLLRCAHADVMVIG